VIKGRVLVLRRSVEFVLVLSLALLLILSSAAAVAYNETPYLADAVKQGELPPVDERLPVEPYVVGPGTLVPEENLNWQPGVPGGTLRLAGLWWNVFEGTIEGLLTAPGMGTKDIHGNILKDFEVNEDNTEFTFYMREGLRWSDGVPVTTEDVRFTYEDVMMNPELYPSFPVKYRSGGASDGDPMKIEIIDDYTFKVIFSQPYGQFLVKIADPWADYTDFLKPKHYLQQFHIKYASAEQIEASLKEEGLDEWWELFTLKDSTSWTMNSREDIGFPRLSPWIMVDSPEGIEIFVRNPYYFKVDVNGTQLPYIDVLHSTEISDEQMALMMFMGDAADYSSGEVFSLRDVAVLMDNREQGQYDVSILENQFAFSYFLNQTYDDAVLRKVASDIRFRKALCYAIDRQEISDVVFFGLASPGTVRPTEFSPTEANRLLDEMGMTARDAQGFRLTPDGEPFELFVETCAHRPEYIPIGELLVEQFKDVGINARLRVMEDSLWSEKLTTNGLMSNIHIAHTPLWADGIWIQDVLPGLHSEWGVEWLNWFETGGKTGEEPPENVKELFDMYVALQKTVPHSEEFSRIMGDILDWGYENVYDVIIADNIGKPVLTDVQLKNVPDSGMALMASFNMEQFFFAAE
jgi:peptide/nickel transport system substrate-binding protein